MHMNGLKETLVSKAERSPKLADSGLHRAANIRSFTKRQTRQIRLRCNAIAAVIPTPVPTKEAYEEAVAVFIFRLIEQLGCSIQ